MSRELPSWARSSRARSLPKATLPGDLRAIVTALIRRRVPEGAPPRPLPMRETSPRAEWSGRNMMLALLGLRVDVEILGSDVLAGLRQPLVFAANEQGALDHELLRRCLPKGLRPTAIRPSRALARGRSVVVFTDEPLGGRPAGEFPTVAADFAQQFNVAIVPVGMVGTFKLKDILKLSLRTKPKVSIRFGSPVYMHGRTLAEATAELQARVEQLVNEGDLSWWSVMRRPAADPQASVSTGEPRWRRLWIQSAPKPPTHTRIWQ